MMQRLSATPGPYARKVRIALAEKGLPFELLPKVPWNADTSTPRSIRAPRSAGVVVRVKCSGQ